jgi:hypothetical protein
MILMAGPFLNSNNSVFFCYSRFSWKYEAYHCQEFKNQYPGTSLQVLQLLSSKMAMDYTCVLQRLFSGCDRPCTWSIHLSRGIVQRRIIVACGCKQVISDIAKHTGCNMHQLWEKSWCLDQILMRLFLILKVQISNNKAHGLAQFCFISRTWAYPVTYWNPPMILFQSLALYFDQ